MEKIIYQKTYQEYKQELDAVLTRTAEDFVQIGYLLKVARDTNVLAESGYATVTDFAKAEYGMLTGSRAEHYRLVAQTIPIRQ